MQGLFGAPSNSRQKPSYTALSIQTSARGGVIPVVYGQTRIPYNLLWWGDFKTIKHEQDVGKMGGGGEITTYTYKVAAILGLCEGPINNILKMWQDKKTSIALFGGTKYVGTCDQPRDSWMITHHEDEALAYSCTAYVINSAWQLGESNTLPAYSFEILGRLSNNGDANPADVIFDVLTNDRYGARYPLENVSVLDTFRAYCHAIDFLISPAFDQQRKLSDYLEDIIKGCNAAPRWSQGVLDIIPYGDVAITRGVTYNPADPVFDLTDNDFLNADDPVRLVRKRMTDTYNVEKVEYFDRAFQYNTDIATVSDLDGVRTYGLRQNQVNAFHFFCTDDRAMLSGQLLLQRQRIMNTFEFELGWKWIVLDPMDVGYITDIALGLNRTKVRITEIQENENGDLTIIAEEMIDEISTAYAYAKQSASGQKPPEQTASIESVNTPIIFEPPASLCNVGSGYQQVWCAVSGDSSQNYQGCYAWASFDGNSYQKISDLILPSPTGILNTELPSGSSPDLTNILSVELADTELQLLSTSEYLWNLLSTLSYVDGELIAYQWAQLVASGLYNLTNLNRGCYGSTIGVHTQGSKFAYLGSGNVYKYSYLSSRIGQTIHLKFQAQTTDGVQDLASCTEYTHTLVGNP